MSIKNLIKLLSRYNPESEVYVLSQERYPFELKIEVVMSRDECQKNAMPNAKPSDVFIVEGVQTKKGVKVPWDMVRKHRVG